MRLGLAVLFAAVGVALVPVAASGGSAPPGATARCRDGTYSFSQHHSGTCSHHGGVAAWLDGGMSSPAGPGTIDVGTTVLLQTRTKTSGCTLGALPDRRCSPGAYYSKLTRQVVCSASFRTSSVRNVPDSEKHQVELEYGLAPRPYGSTLEIDHIVSLEIGGSNDIANLYPERADAHPGFHVKDVLENKLHALVCTGQIALHTAQRQIAANWEGLYKEVFGVSPAR
jgi:hypothetical protein